MRREERLNDFEEVLRLNSESHQAKMWTSIPAIITSVNLEAQTCACQPAIQGEVTLPNGSVQSVNLPLLVDVPIQFPRAGGFAITFPVKAGDECLVIFASRCIDSWWQSGGVGAPAEHRMHDLSDGVAILGITSQPKRLNNISTNSLQIRNDSGTTFIDITDNKIELNADSVILRGSSKVIIDAGGTGIVYKPNVVNTYTNGVTGSNSAPTPPEISE